ncbi:MAG: hypothetical protein WBC71_05725 [Salaquimonas sp.]
MIGFLYLLYTALTLALCGFLFFLSEAHLTITPEFAWVVGFMAFVPAYLVAHHLNKRGIRTLSSKSLWKYALYLTLLYLAVPVALNGLHILSHENPSGRFIKIITDTFVPRLLLQNFVVFFINKLALPFGLAASRVNASVSA